MSIIHATVLTFLILYFCFILLVQGISLGFGCPVSQTCTSLFLNLDLSTFLLDFSRSITLCAGLELLLGVQFSILCAVLQTASNLGELGIDRAQEFAVVPPTRSYCKSLSIQAQLGFE